MALLTALDIVQEFCRRKALSSPTSLTVSALPDTTQIIEALHLAGDDICRRFLWPANARKVLRTATGVESQGDVRVFFGPDYESSRPLTIWDVSLRRRILGPLTQIAQQTLVNLAAVGPLPYWRLEENLVKLFPAPTAGRSLSAVYSSEWWIYEEGDGDPERKPRITADADKFFLNERLLGLGLEVEWLKLKGFPYAEAMTMFESAFATLTSRAGNAGVLSMSGYERGQPSYRVIP